jgi:hypothetical protein
MKGSHGSISTVQNQNYSNSKINTKMILLQMENYRKLKGVLGVRPNYKQKAVRTKTKVHIFGPL